MHCRCLGQCCQARTSPGLLARAFEVPAGAGGKLTTPKPGTYQLSLCASALHLTLPCRRGQPQLHVPGQWQARAEPGAHAPIKRRVCWSVACYTLRGASSAARKSSRDTPCPLHSCCLCISSGRHCLGLRGALAYNSHDCDGCSAATGRKTEHARACFTCAQANAFRRALLRALRCARCRRA